MVARLPAGIGLLAAVLWSGGFARAAAAEDEDRPARVERAIDAARNFLLSQIGPDGVCPGEYPPEDARYGGKTALCAYALLAAGEDPRHPSLDRSLRWLSGAKMNGTYAVALRACAFSELKDPQYLPFLKMDVAWLLQAANKHGGYTYTSLEGRDVADYDNSNSQMAILGVWSALRRGVEVPDDYWRQIQEHWRSCQQLDGGWSYSGIVTPRGHPSSYGSMTAAGLATLFVCFDQLRREDFDRCEANGEDEAINRAIEWMGRRFSSEKNPGKENQYFTYWLYSVSRVGLAGGLKCFRGHEWYAEGADRLLATQNRDGSWNSGDLQVAETAFSLLFLVRGRTPILINKLQFPGRWNCRPRDAAHLTDWIGQTFETPVAWQVVDLASPLRDWQDAPVLYLSGAGPLDLAEEDLLKLRAFVLQGGLILSEAAGNDPDFNLDMQKLYKRLFPHLSLKPLPEDHPLYSVHFRLGKDSRGLMGVSNGIRLLAIHSPQQLSLALQRGPREDPKSASAPRNPRAIFELMANIYFAATDKGFLPPRGVPLWPQPKAFQPKARWRLARVKYAGDYEPEPLAWDRLAVLLGNRHAIQLETAVVDLAELDPARWPLAAMTGTGAFRLDAPQRVALRSFLAGGGTLLVDAADGSREFADSVEKEILPLVPASLRAPVALGVLTRGLEPIETVTYRRDYAALLGDARNRPQVEAVVSNDRLVILFSPVDLTSGLAGVRWAGIRGYTPETAVKLVTNLLAYLSSQEKRMQEKPKSP